MIATAYQHIAVDSEGVALIAGTSMKVVELVLDSKAYGWSPEELHFQHPYLTMGQIYSALAYYWDHKDEVDRDIEWRLRRVDVLAEELPPTGLDDRLRSLGRI